MDEIHLVGVVESDWPERSGSNIFYPASLLRDLGWPPDADRLASARARFRRFADPARTTRRRVVVHARGRRDRLPVAFLEDVASAGLAVERPETDDLRAGLRARGAVPAAGSSGRRAGRGRGLARAADEPHESRRSAVSRRGRRARAASSTRSAASSATWNVRSSTSPARCSSSKRNARTSPACSALERGQLLHGVFETFFDAWRRAGPDGRLRRQSRRSARAVRGGRRTASAGAARGRSSARTDLPARIGRRPGPCGPRVCGRDRAGRSAWSERLLEYPFEGAFASKATDGPQPVRVRGKADRIDLLEDGTLRVVDYKLGRAPKPARALQLPIYGVCAQQQLERTARRAPADCPGRLRRLQREERVRGSRREVGRCRRSAARRPAAISRRHRPDRGAASTRRARTSRGRVIGADSRTSAARTTSVTSERSDRRPRPVCRSRRCSMHRPRLPRRSAGAPVPAGAARRRRRGPRVRGRPAQQRRARSLGRHRQDVGARGALPEPAQGRASIRRTSWRSPSRGRPPPRCGSASSASCGRRRSDPSSTGGAGWSCAIVSARSPSAPSTRSACRCCASFRSRRTWIPAFDIADETEVPRLVAASLDRTMRILVEPGPQRRRRRAGARAARDFTHARGAGHAARPPAGRLGRARSLPRARPARPDVGRALRRARPLALQTCARQTFPEGSSASSPTGRPAIRGMPCSSATRAGLRELRRRSGRDDPRGARTRQRRTS